MGVAVKRRIGCGEDDCAIENRKDALARLPPAAIPQLQVTAVLLRPLLVEIDQHVQAPIELQLRMDVEVRVDLQKAARLDLMQAATAEIRIRDQPVDSCKSLQPEQHLE